MTTTDCIFLITSPTVRVVAADKGLQCIIGMTLEQMKKNTVFVLLVCNLVRNGDRLELIRTETKGKPDGVAMKVHKYVIIETILGTVCDHSWLLLSQTTFSSPHDLPTGNKEVMFSVHNDGSLSQMSLAKPGQSARTLSTRRKQDEKSRSRTGSPAGKDSKSRPNSPPRGSGPKSRPNSPPRGSGSKSRPNSPPRGSDSRSRDEHRGNVHQRNERHHDKRQDDYSSRVSHDARGGDRGGDRGGERPRNEHHHDKRHDNYGSHGSRVSHDARVSHVARGGDRASDRSDEYERRGSYHSNVSRRPISSCTNCRELGDELAEKTKTEAGTRTQMRQLKTTIGDLTEKYEDLQEKNAQLRRQLVRLQRMLPDSQDKKYSNQPAHSVSGDLPDNSDWTCTACTIVNSASCTDCTACNMVKGTRTPRTM